jgi:hypothetical protein
MSDVLSSYSAALLYVPYTEYMDKPDYWGAIATQDISPPGSAQYYAGNTNWMTDTERRYYTEMQRKVVTGITGGNGGTRVVTSMTPEDKMVAMGLADNYADDINRFKSERGLESTKLSTKTTDPTVPVVPEPTADPGSIINYYYNTTNNYNQDPSQGPSQSDSFSWLFPMMMIMMLMNNFGGVQGQQPPEKKAVYEIW